MTHSGSFVSIRGGDKYPEMIKMTARKPLRVFLSSGKMDLNNQFGSWVTANQAMFDALTATGYHVRYLFGDGGHVGFGEKAALPETMVWLWRGYRR